MHVTERLKGESSKEYAMRVIRENIISLELEPGTSISANELASEIPVSRGPIREALSELSKIGIVEVYPQSGCKISMIDYTVVENEDLPAELKKLIDNKKTNTLRMTYTTKDYTYVVAGFGTKETSGYSIKVNDVYKSGNAIYADFTLMGPAENEPVNEVPTTPYIVLKYEKRDETVVFRM